MNNKKFIVVEGIDGAGKSTICNYIVKLLNNFNIKNIIKTHEPGGTPIAEKLRNIIKFSQEEKISYKTELLLIYAARLQLLDNIIRKNVNINWIISDRYDLSTYAYQIGGRNINKKNILFLQNFIKNNIKPDITIYLDVNPIISLQRINLRNYDRIEKESISFFSRVRMYYLKIAKKNKTIKIVNANKNLKDVKLSVKKIINKLIFV
ncbi:dTMP kinase [Enterobacteriaceae endosymbiont of Donacia bicoloricornis]|uniref:dTMP kinase n=1 Tax=Enterobacteriaceae endosymbiont of Donacia bicoloricornis TaxID=2675772 RepID=UPI001449F42E|nr:dTMP kinase [Enterobacteriaceae endosymbiont of Donacia bicoloricornis]QJC37625.1 dTMP kinase [Enterobacteriaceae endosymbiont of Donacia bicoloricornis]